MTYFHPVMTVDLLHNLQYKKRKYILKYIMQNLNPWTVLFSDLAIDNFILHMLEKFDILSR